MLLKSIAFHNFRPFKGTQKVLLTNDKKEDANVTVLLGDNTYGKTTFVLAFIWCLYGESKFNTPESILNKKIEASMTLDKIETAYVEIEFDDNNKAYTMRRTQKFSKVGTGRLKASDSFASLKYVDGDGETKTAGASESEIKDAITAILPHDLSTFFFFEGEKTMRLGKKI